jgi:hypothetical protein
MKRIAIAILVMLPVAFVTSVTVTNLRSAMNRSRQKQTMATIQRLGVILDSGRRGIPSRLDGWGHPIHVTRGAHGGYTIHAADRDGKFEQLIYPGSFTSFDNDIVYADGSFITFPFGI